MDSFDKELSMLIDEMNKKNIPLSKQIEILKEYSIKLNDLHSKLHTDLLVGTAISMAGVGITIDEPVIGVLLITVGICGTLIDARKDIEKFENKIKNKKY